MTTEVHAHAAAEQANPRAAGFNYGAGWSGAVNTQIYKDCEPVAQRLRDAAHDLEQRAWAIDMLLRNARLAETDLERTQALCKLHEWFNAPANNPTGGDPTPNYPHAAIAAIPTDRTRLRRATSLLAAADWSAFDDTQLADAKALTWLDNDQHVLTDDARFAGK